MAAEKSFRDELATWVAQRDQAERPQRKEALVAFLAVRADVIEATIVANRLTGESADRFRGLAWAAVDGATTPEAIPSAVRSVPPARVA